MAINDADSIARALDRPVSRGEALLFTGAGFSVGAKDASGTDVPQARDLTNEISNLVWPDDPVSDGLSLPDTYAAALREARGTLTALLKRRLTVDPASITDEHRLWLSMPWRRAYTLNIDDLATATSRAYTLPRHITTFSGLDGRLPIGSPTELLYVHLNGTLDDVPNVTFTEPQYGLRHTTSNPLYEQLASDLLSYTIIFVGTELRESLFWRYVGLRDEKGARGVKEMRPRSYLVTPSLTPDRRRLLEAYNVEWVEATAAEFACDVLARLDDASRRGHGVMRARGTRSSEGVILPSVAELGALPAPPRSDYLWGAEPSWDDIKAGRAVERAFEESLALPSSGCGVVTGTAGAGTTTTLMRLALQLVADGRDVRWVDANHAFDGRALARWLRNHSDDIVVVADNADTFGRSLRDLVADVVSECPNVLLLLGMRASRIDALLPGWQPDADRNFEIAVPLLDDDDIDRLLGALARENKLGELKGLSPAERVQRLQKECGRQLLVAMYEATTGRRFEEKVLEEFEELPAEQQTIYAIVAIASEMRFVLTRDQVLLASGDVSNTALYALGRLAARGLLLERSASYSARHRRIAEVVAGGLRRSGRLLTPYRGLLRAVAVRYDRDDRRSPATKLLVALMSHSRIGRTFAIGDARVLYQDIEDLCKDDYHFWLQRGSLEVQYGDLYYARPYLLSARDGGQGDHRVHTEWAYYLLKHASRDPRAADAQRDVDEAQEILLEQIERNGDSDTYAWHVYGSQMLAWLRRAPLADHHRQQQLEVVKDRIEEGTRAHPNDRELAALYRDLRNEWLMTTVPPDRR